MIRVTVDIIPFGVEAKKKTITEIKIDNDGTGDVFTGNYDFSVYDVEHDHAMLIDKIKDHRRSDGVWPLIKKVIDKI